VRAYILPDIRCVTATDYMWLEQELTNNSFWAFICSNCTEYVVGGKNKSQPVQRFVALCCKLVLNTVMTLDCVIKCLDM